MFNPFKKIKELEYQNKLLKGEVAQIRFELDNLVEHFNLKFCWGENNRPHYRTKPRPKPKKVGRPRKNA
jgi:hypothetical protein